MDVTQPPPEDPHALVMYCNESHLALSYLATDYIRLVNRIERVMARYGCPVCKGNVQIPDGGCYGCLGTGLAKSWFRRLKEGTIDE